jgi:cytochrome b pre-mRNA-processing protein 3
MGMGRKMKAFADAFYGRLSAYDGAADVDALAQALARNLYRGAAVDGRARALAAYALAARTTLKQSLPDALDFGPLPTI